VPTGVREGEVVAGKYRLGEVLGSGAMGTVFGAHHLLLDQKVAIKFLIPEALGHADAIIRFLREARAAVRIKSEHVVRVLDVAVLESGAPYLVMEYLEGCDLAVWLQRHGRLQAEAAVDFILQACDAIAEAHGLGIIHRDVKPANLFAVQHLGVVQSIKVLDFGISKAAALVSATQAPSETPQGGVITQEKMPIGSPCYMSPEQMESARDVDARTDIWALGVTLWELVTGHVPFEGESLVQVYSRIKSGSRLRLRDSSPHVVRGLESVMLKCLEPDRDHRYASVSELAAALVPFGSNRAATYVERMDRAERPSDLGPTDSPGRATPSPRVLPVLGPDKTLVSPVAVSAMARRRRPSLLLPAFVVVILGGAAAVKLVTGSRASDRFHETGQVAVPAAPSPDAQPGPAAPAEGHEPQAGALIVPPTENASSAPSLSDAPPRIRAAVGPSSPPAPKPAAPYPAVGPGPSRLGVREEGEAGVTRSVRSAPPAASSSSPLEWLPPDVPK
jgi:serine/threonine-protein kinase